MPTTHLGPCALFLLAACATTQPQTGRRPAGQELPVTRVILYQNGIGYFERRGEVDGDVLTLQVRPDQINDMLKSLTVVDTRSGRAVSVSLPLEKRSADLLAELPEQVRNASGLLQVLTVFRGANVAVDGGKGRARGRIIGVEAYEQATSGQPARAWRLTLKEDGGGLVIYPVDEIERVAIEEQTLEIGLDKSLDVALDSGNWKPITLSVRLAGETPHALVVAYIKEMPVWKPSYRVVLGDKETTLLQGWAVVDNVSGENWEKIKLSLVAGNPVSFKYDLHSPQFTSRVDLTPQHRRLALAPAVEKSGMAVAPPPPPPSVASASAPAYDMAAPAAAGRSVGSGGGGRKAKAKRASRADFDERSLAGESAEEEADSFDFGGALEQQMPVAATGEAVGALFRYDIADPVTVPDGTSNLVSVVNARVRGEEVVLFRGDRDDSGQPLPYRAVRLVNSTGSTLERGPVAIYSGTTFMGEGFVDRMEKDATAFLTYAADGGVNLVQSQSTSEEGGRLLKITAGMIESEVISVLKQRFVVKNDHEAGAQVFVKTARPGGKWELKTRPTDTVETGAAYFFPLSAPPRGEASFEAVWQQPLVRRISIDTDLSTTVLKMYLGSGKVPAAIAPTLTEILGLKQRISDNAREYARLQTQHQQLAGDQNRVRDNLNLLRKTPGNRPLMDDLTDKLAKLEGELGRLTAKMVKLSEENAELQRKMEALIRTVSLDNAGAAS